MLQVRSQKIDDQKYNKNASDFFWSVFVYIYSILKTDYYEN